MTPADGIGGPRSTEESPIGPIAMPDPDASSAASTAMRIAVVGGGITGLAAAHRLLELQSPDRPVRVTLFEASARLGGVFGSERIGAYLIERGADSFITNKPWGVDLCRRLGMEDRLISTDARFRRSLILSAGRPVPTPEGFNLLAPGRIWPIVTTPLLSWKGKLRLAAECLLPRRRDETDESLADFVRRRFGQEVLDRIVQPLVGGIYTSDPERLSLHATLPRFPELERTHGSLIRGLRRSQRRERRREDASGARYGLFVTPREGMQDLLDALVEAIRPDVELRLNTPVSSLARQPSGIRLAFSADGGPEESALLFDRVILALPAYRAAALLQGEHAELSAALKTIEYASSAIVVSGHRLSDVDHPLDAFGLVIPHREGRRILAVSFLSRKFPGRAPEDRVVLRTFVGGAMQPEEFERTDAEIERTVMQELRDLLGVRGTPEFVTIARYPRAMPQYTVGHQERVREIRRLAEQIPEAILAGNAYEGVGIPDCIHSGEQAAEAARCSR
jgi:protoporphyrinogen/coproporphyrinogen III oxidase